MRMQPQVRRLMEMIDKGGLYVKDVPPELRHALTFVLDSHWAVGARPSAPRDGLLVFWPEGRAALAQDRMADESSVGQTAEAIEVIESKETPTGRKTGRPKKTERKSIDIVLEALCLWHGYDDGTVTNLDPATNNGLADLVNRRARPGERKLANNALKRFLDRHGGTKKYKTACQGKTIGTLLMSWRGDLLDKHSPLLREEPDRDD